jgi:hypothetical protein
MEVGALAMTFCAVLPSGQLARSGRAVELQLQAP